MNKKSFSMVSKLLLVVVLASGCSTADTSTKTSTENKTLTAQVYNRPETVSTTAAKQLLVDGNKRYVNNKVLPDDLSNTRRKNLSANGQKPLAVIVSCSDSRVPPELVFDQALGDLFIIRNAGNVIDPVVLGSVEYGVEHLNAPLVVVLGHEKCGAVKATIDGGEASQNVTSIIDKIKPSFEKVKTKTKDANEIYSMTIDENIKNSMANINGSPIIQKLVQEKKITVIGAKYHMDTGEVSFDMQ